MDSAKRVMAGTFGELWWDGEKVAETYKFQAKVNINREDVPMCGIIWTDSKIKSLSGKGSIGFYKVNSRVAHKLADAISKGQDPRGTIISKLNDPDAYGSERVVVKDVCFDDITLADWEAGVLGKVEAPYTFRGYDFLDKVA